MADRTGQQLGNYQLTRLLGRGGFAEVYLGEHRYLNTLAAVKVLHTQLEGKQSERFRSEAQTIAHLQHPNIVRVLEFGVEETTPYLIMSYAPNGTLRLRHPQGKQLLLTTIVHYVRQIAGALQYVHDQKLIHRDIKPQNMLIGPNNEVLLGDFGLALISESSYYQSIQDMAGTIAYMAPEQIQGKPRRASDQYALGVVVYEWLSGNLPFHGSFSEIASQHILTLPPKFSEKIPAISPDVEEVVITALAKDPQQRFASIRAFATAFEQACQPRKSSPTVVLVNQSPLLDRTIVPSSQPLYPSVSIDSGDVLNQLVLNSVSDTPAEPTGHLPLPSVSANSLDQPHLPSVIEILPVQQNLSPQPPFSAYPLNQSPKNTDPAIMQGQTKLRFSLFNWLTISQRKRHTNALSIPITTPLAPRRSKPSLITIVSSTTFIVLLIIVAMAYYAYQTATATAVTITLSPQTHVISQVYTITADPLVQTPNVGTMSIPARAFYSTKHSSQTGPTTGQVNCVLGVFQCQQGVSQDDVNNLVSQMQPDLENTITRELQQKIANARGLKISSINFQIVSIKSNPGIDEVGKAVTVTLEEKGSAGYILNNDVQNMAQQLVTQKAQQYGQNYMLLHASITTGAPVVEGVDSSGIITINIAAGCIVEFQFPASELQAMRDHLKSRTLKDATNYLAHQQGVDSTTVGIHFTRGKSNTLPGDPQYITIVPINPASLPPVQLQSVPTPTYTPSTDGGADLTPTPVAALSPTPSATPTNN